MDLVSRAPCDRRLVGLVDRLWAADPADGAPGSSVSEWILPTCRPQMILSSDQTLFVGPKSRAELVERRIDQRAWGVSFVAGAAVALVGVGGEETCDRTIDLDALWNFGSLVDQLLELDSPSGLDRLETALVNLVGAGKSLEVLAAERAIRAGAAAVQVPEALGVDRRKFVPEFRRSVGVGMKHYERICRFNRSVEALRRSDAAPLATVAADFGLADQAHLTREVVHFAGVSPKQLHRDGGRLVNHVAAGDSP